MLVDALKAETERLDEEAVAVEDYLKILDWHGALMKDLQKTGFIGEPHIKKDEQIEAQKGSWLGTVPTIVAPEFPPGSLVSYKGFDGSRVYGVVVAQECERPQHPDAVWAYWTSAEGEAGYMRPEDVRLEAPDSF